MAKSTPPSHHLLLLLSVLAASVSLISATCTFPPSLPPHNIKGMFVFGSSYVDNGNNNFLRNTIAKADYPPYGIDFTLGPSGRFTNGKNVVDLLGEELGLPQYIPVFTNPTTKGRKIVYGVSFASGASGILDETGSVAGNVISLEQQIRNFEEVTLVELAEQVGCRSRESLPKYLFVLGTGGNDYTQNYFLKKRANTNFNVSLNAFTANLIVSLSLRLQKLYGLGARKFVLMSLYPIGCSPVVKASWPNRNGCVQAYNVAAHLFNNQLKSLVDEIKPQMPGSDLVYVNAYKVIADIIRNPACKGFRDASTACCEVASIGGSKSGTLCKRGGSTCANRNTHVFFDGIHPTEAVNKLIAKSAYASNLTTLVYPINVKHLARV